MNKAFIFDLDGVIIDSENTWKKIEKKLLGELFGKEIYIRLGSTVGLSIETIFHNAVRLGTKISLETLLNGYNKNADFIYRSTPLTEGIQELGKILIEKHYKIGIVSASPPDWVKLVTDRLSFRKDISVIISLHERKDLAHKPSPAGYLEAIRVLRVTPETTIILEDSNAGITSAKAAGAYTIGLKQNLVEGYIQKGADIYAHTLNEVKSIVLLRKT